MTLQEFINKNNGKKVDFDGKFGAQCVDLYRFYLRDVWKVPQTPSVKGAYQILDTLPPTFQKFINGIPQVGDVIIWNENYVKNGHVAIVTSTNGVNFKSFDQNNPEGSACRIADHTYKNVIGWFRPLKNETMKLVNDRGTVYIITGNKDKRKIGISDEASLGLFGDEPQEIMDTSSIPQYNTIASNGIVISSK